MANTVRRRRRQFAIAGVAFAILGAASCVSDRSHAATRVAPTSRTVADASWLADSPKHADVLASVRDYWRTYLTVTHPPFDPAVAEAIVDRVATGPAAVALVDVARREAIAGLTIRGQISSHPRLVSQSESNASVVDCVDDGTGVFRADGARIDTDDPRPHRMRLRLVRSHEGWRVTSMAQSESPCVLG